MMVGKAYTPFRHWSRWRDSNPQPTAYDAVALPVELQRRIRYLQNVLSVTIIIMTFFQTQPLYAQTSRSSQLLTKDKTNIELSQQFSIQMIEYEISGAPITFELTSTQTNQYQLHLSPKTAHVRYFLIDRTPRPYRQLLVEVQKLSRQWLIPEVEDEFTAYYRLQNTDLTFELHDAIPTHHNATIAKETPLASVPDNSFTVLFNTEAIKAPFKIQLRENVQLPLPQDLVRLSPLYQFDVLQKNQLNTSFPIQLKIRYNNTSDSSSKSLYFFDRNRNGWVKLPSYHDVERHEVQAMTHLPFAPVALFADTQSHDGIASWYKYRGCMCAASRMYPKGTKLLVTRLKTGKSIPVIINDYGPEPWTGRIIDLDRVAFAALGSLRAGLIYVMVAPHD